MNRVITEIVHLNAPIVSVVPGSTMMHYLCWNSCSEMQIVRLLRESVKIRRNWNNVMTWKDCINSMRVSEVRHDWKVTSPTFSCCRNRQKSWNSKCVTCISIIYLLNCNHDFFGAMWKKYYYLAQTMGFYSPWAVLAL